MESYFEFFYSSPNFEEIDAKSIRYITDRTIRKSDAALAVILGSNTQTFEMKMEKWDELTHKLSSISGIIFLLAHTSSNEEVYKQANQSIQVLQRYQNGLSLNEELYKAIKKYSLSDDARWLKGYKKKFIKETVREFERNGFALVQQDRDTLRNMKDQLSDLANEFSRNIAEHQYQIIISEKDTEGLPKDYKKRHRMEDGMYKITLDSPSYRPFMRYAKSEKWRKELYIKYLNKGNPKNTGVLIKTIALRNQMASLLGYKTYAQYVIEERMAKTPNIVWSFEEELTKKVKPKAEKDYKELLSITEGKEELRGWETGYYNNILLEKNYNLNAEEVKQYFELNNVFKGIFIICKELFGIDFVKMYHHSVWHEDVVVYEVRKKNTVVGKMYLDLYPRPNKYSHAACFGLVSGRETTRGYQTPHAALVCNFPPSTSDSPSLLSHDQVTTVFHEFGHGLHQLLTQSPLAAFAGTHVARDFVEVPSQLFENWAWDYDILKEFAFHYKTREVFPKELFDKMAYQNFEQNLLEELEDEYQYTCPRQPNLLPFALEMLTYLQSKGYQLHILTNGFEESQKLKLEHSGILPFFKNIITSDCTGYTKPNPIIFNHALTISNATPQNSIMIGDSFDADILGARSLGMKTIFYNPHKKTPQYSVASYDIACWKEIEKIL